MSEHPITPPPELVQQWWDGTHGALYEFEAVVTQAARWGADQELEACCEYLARCAAWEPEDVKEFCDLRRPKPLSLKELALLQLDTLNADLGMHGLGCDLSQIRRALESLPD